MEKAEKIDVRDLSIGDWVRDGNGIIAKVRGIENWSDGYILNVQTVSGSICTLSATGALPIPITAKVLEKNGWSEFSDYHNSWKLDIASDKRVWMFKNSHDWTFQVMSWGLGHNHSVAKAYIKDIHELQHALRLAKTGKEIVL